MNTKFGKVLAIILCVLSINMSSCSQEAGGHRSTFSDGIGFQYNLPSDFCRTPSTESNVLELYCTEGKIIIVVVDAVPNQQPNETLANILGDLQVPPDFYGLSSEKSKIVSDGNYRSIELAKLTSFDDDVFSHNKYPRYIVSANFGSNKVFLAKGYLYNIQFEAKFSDIFFTVVYSFEPFAPP